EHGLNLAQAARASAEGAILGLYQFRRYKSQGADSDEEQTGANGRRKAEGAARQIESLTVLGRGREPALRASVERGRILAEAQNMARDLGNEPANVLTPAEFAARAEQMATECGLECEVFGPDWMRAQAMGALLGVGQGSVNEPRLIVLRYRGGPSSQPGLGLVGKGMTFDSGG